MKVLFHVKQFLKNLLILNRLKMNKRYKNTAHSLMSQFKFRLRLALSRKREREKDQQNRAFKSPLLPAGERILILLSPVSMKVILIPRFRKRERASRKAARERALRSNIKN
ncbi:MAG: hypothetical protein K0R12_659 [Gammaproteobacteria bacterium]|jgi:hypothetical protein|nr:hypothetical protein [Gammaproteobacteria bacterium]